MFFIYTKPFLAIMYLLLAGGAVGVGNGGSQKRCSHL